MADTKYITDKECAEKMQSHYDFIEDTINSAENSLKSEIRHAAMGIKAYVDKQNKELKAELQGDIKELKGDIKQVDEKVNKIIDILVKFTENK